MVRIGDLPPGSCNSPSGIVKRPGGSVSGGSRPCAFPVNGPLGKLSFSDRSCWVTTSPSQGGGGVQARHKAVAWGQAMSAPRDLQLRHRHLLGGNSLSGGTEGFPPEFLDTRCEVQRTMRDMESFCAPKRGRYDHPMRNGGGALRPPTRRSGIFQIPSEPWPPYQHPPREDGDFFVDPREGGGESTA